MATAAGVIDDEALCGRRDAAALLLTTELGQLGLSQIEFLLFPLDRACFLDLLGVGVLDDTIMFLPGFLQVGLPLPQVGYVRVGLENLLGE